ncbi:MAG: dimethylsulfonioproprionate lyase family protein [Pseudomonadota bacterium]
MSDLQAPELDTALESNAEPDYSVFGPSAAAPEVPDPTERLIDLSNWGYLLQEIRYVYRDMPAGGSTPIRRHIEAVADLIGRAVRSNAPVLPRTPQVKPVTKHFGRALDNGEATQMAPLVRALSKVGQELDWRYGYDRMPKTLERKYAYAELLGPRGPVVFTDLIVGLVLFAPATVYPQHAHAGITESYVAMSGAVSQNNAGVYRPGALIFNQPEAEHRITTQTREPTLLLYAWSGHPDTLTDDRMELPKRKRRSA